MKTITQYEIAKILERSQSFVSKRLRKNELRGYEIKLLSKKLKVPAEAFFDKDAQVKYLGKSYLQENDTKKGTHKARQSS